MLRSLCYIIFHSIILLFYFAREVLDFKYDIIVFENLRFARPQEYDKSTFSNISTLGSVFENLHFQWSKTPDTCGLKAKRRKKFRFRKYLGTCGRGLNDFRFSFNLYSSTPNSVWNYTRRARIIHKMITVLLITYKYYLHTWKDIGDKLMIMSNIKLVLCKCLTSVLIYIYILIKEFM